MSESTQEFWLFDEWHECVHAVVILKEFDEEDGVRWVTVAASENQFYVRQVLLSDLATTKEEAFRRGYEGQLNRYEKIERELLQKLRVVRDRIENTRNAISQHQKAATV